MFKMATGTGKMKTAMIAAATQLGRVHAEQNQPLVVVAYCST